MAEKIEQELTLESWARKYGVSTKWDNDKFENREFIKRLDEARPIYEKKKQTENEHS